MNGPDDEFNDFLSRRKPMFGREPDDGLEPPPELDRIVLRQAREAIEVERPQRVFRGPRWGAPLALAATLLLAFTVILNVGMPKKAPVPEVTVQTVSQEFNDSPAAAAPSIPTPTLERARADTADNARAERRAADTTGDPVVDLGVSAEAKPEVAANAPSAPALVSQDEAARYAPAPPAPAVPAARSAGNLADAGVSAANPVAASRTVITSVPPPPSEAQQAMAKVSSAPAWRRDTKSWLAEIDRLRAAGKTAEADSELAEYKREHRAYAVSPDH